MNANCIFMYVLALLIAAQIMLAVIYVSESNWPDAGVMTAGAASAALMAVALYLQWMVL